MKPVINFILAALSFFAPVPTAWAIWAGTQQLPAFPMDPIAAGIGAVAVVATTAAAALLVVDILKQNQEARTEDEQKMSLSVWYAWTVLALCILGEVVLSLLIVIFPAYLSFGVLAFPMMTLAGVFVVALRLTLGERLTQRDALRAKLAQEEADRKAKQEQEERDARAEQAREKAERKAERKEARQARQAAKVAAIPEPVAASVEQVAPQEERKPVTDSELLTYLASNPGESHKQVAAHFGVTRQAIGQRVKKLYEVKA
jgi:flagellar biosynthesis GTPase FlhF